MTRNRKYRVAESDDAATSSGSDRKRPPCHSFPLTTWRWIVLTGVHVCYVFMDGIPNSGGVFLVHWKEQFDASTAELSLVLSLQLVCYHLAGAVAGAAVHRFGSRPVVIAAGVTSFTGIFLSSLAPSPLMLYITSGLLAGSGFGSTLNACTVSLAEYFPENYGFAQSVASGGSSVGIVALPPLTQYLASQYGWRGTYLVLAGLAGNIVVCGMLLRPVGRFLPKHDAQLEERTQLKQNGTQNASTQFDGDQELADNGQCQNINPEECEKELAIGQDHIGQNHNQIRKANEEYGSGSGYKSGFIKLTSARQPSLLQRLGNTTGFSFLFSHYRFTLIVIVIFFVGISFSAVVNSFVLSAIDRGISEQAASFLMSFFGIGSFGGKIVSGVVLGKNLMRITTIYILSVFGWGVSVMLLRAPSSYGGFIVVGFSVGLFSGINICTCPVIVKHVVGVDKLGRAFGVLMVFAGTGCLIGPVLAGAIFDATASFDIPFYSFGAVVTLGAFPLLFLGKLKRLEEHHQRQKDRNCHGDVAEGDEHQGTVTIDPNATDSRPNDQVTTDEEEKWESAV
ncbi:monocarboxylate transporter 9-like [Diadema antillarum]|uniref:monocarboxylate transporter 9-like n=1 Tax=Diadema antillarum TaxID=105358 RepID=UPI003A85F027